MELKQGKVTDFDVRSFYENGEMQYLFLLEIDENYEFKQQLSVMEYNVFVSKILRGFNATDLFDIIEKETKFEVNDSDELTKLVLNDIEIETM